jgi:hypothetical protein
VVCELTVKTLAISTHLELDLNDLILYCVLSCRSNVADGATRARRQHHLHEKIIMQTCVPQISTPYAIHGYVDVTAGKGTVTKVTRRMQEAGGARL